MLVISVAIFMYKAIFNTLSLTFRPVNMGAKLFLTAFVCKTCLELNV